jgi:hypothetical protein
LNAHIFRLTEVRLPAERQLGEFLKAMPKNEGAKGSVVTGSGRVPVKDETPTLARIGITRKAEPILPRFGSCGEPLNRKRSGALIA